MLSCKFDSIELDLPRLDAFIRQDIPSGFAVHNRSRGDLRFCRDTIKRIGADEDRVSLSLGTLGGGNHFIEAGLGADGGLWLTIHSGSWGFGLQIAKHPGRHLRNRGRTGTGPAGVQLQGGGMNSAAG